MTKLDKYSADELKALPLSQLIVMYNEFAAELGQKQLKKFRDKPTAVKRVLAIQEDYEFRPQPEPEVVEETVEEAVKESIQENKEEQLELFSKEDLPEQPKKKRGRKSSLSLQAELEYVSGRLPKEGTIEASLYTVINKNLCCTVADVIAYVTKHHCRPRSNEPVDEAYVIHNIKWFIKKGHIEVINS